MQASPQTNSVPAAATAQRPRSAAATAKRPRGAAVNRRGRQPPRKNRRLRPAGAWAHGSELQDLRDGGDPRPGGASPPLVVSYKPTWYASEAEAEEQARLGGRAEGLCVTWADERLRSDSDAAWFLGWEVINGTPLISRAVLEGRLRAVRYHASEYRVGHRARLLEGVLYAEVVYRGPGKYKGKSEYVQVPLLDAELRQAAERLEGAAPAAQARDRPESFSGDRDPSFKEACNASLAHHARELVRVRGQTLRALVLDAAEGASCRALGQVAQELGVALSADVPNFCPQTCDELERLALPGVRVHRRSLEALLQPGPPAAGWDVAYLDFCNMLHGNTRAIRRLLAHLDPRPGSLLALTFFGGRGALEWLTGHAGELELTRAVYSTELGALLRGAGWRVSLLDYRPSGTMCFWLFRLHVPLGAAAAAGHPRG
eukprot:g70887.t1